MKEWNGLQLEKNELRSMDENVLENALVVISNLIARATTKWTLEETKLFLCMIAKIKTRDEMCWVTLPKKDIAEKLNIDPSNRPKMRDMFKRMVNKSYIQIDGDSKIIGDGIEYMDGVLLTGIKSTKTSISVRFNDMYMPLLDQLSSHFTEFYLEYVKDFTRLSSYNLYVYLCSWHDPNYMHQNRKVKKNELHQIFNLDESDYWRNYGTDKAKFDWSDFEKRVLNPAIDEINSLGAERKCDMLIESCEKIKKGKFVLGYDIKYVFIDKDGFAK